MSFTDKVLQLLKNKGLSPSKMLSDLKLGKNQFTYWKKHGNIPNGTTLKKIADYLGVSISYFFFDEDDQQKNSPPATEVTSEETELKVWGHKRGSASWEHIDSKDFEEESPTDHIDKQILELLQKLPQEEKLKLLGRLEAMVDFLK